MKREIIYSMRGPKNLAEMTTEEVAEALKHTDLIVFAVGATEEHGPHLPLACDMIQGMEVSRRIVAKFAAEGIRAVAGPPIPFGVSLQQMDFPGTISLTPATLTAVIKEVCNSLIKHGFHKIVLMVSHDGNIGAAYSAAQELSQQPNVRILLINWLPFLRKYYPQILKSKGGGHGGEGETARVLAAIPELVRMDRAQVGPLEGKEKVEGDEPMHFGGGIFDPLPGMKEETPVGYFGDPTVATAETGEKCYDVIVNVSCQIIKKHFRLK
jgi:creatinine amidohydrolase